MNTAPADDPLLRIRACLDDLAELDGTLGTDLRVLHERLEANRFHLLVLGEFKRGKSSVINALIGSDLLPVGVIPLTAIATVIHYGRRTSAEVFFDNGERREIDPGSLIDYVTEKGNPRNVKGVREVQVSWPSPWLAGGVRLIDTPGIGSVHHHNTGITYRYLPKADAVLFVLSADQPIGSAELEFLDQVRGYAGGIFVALNKIDLLTESEVSESVDFVSRTIARALGRKVRIYPISARAASNRDAPESAPASSAGAFSRLLEDLENFLSQDRNLALATALAKAALRIVTQKRAAAELSIASLQTPVEDLRRKVAVFEDKLRVLRREAEEFSPLLRAEVGRLTQQVTGEVEAFKLRLLEQVERGIRAHFESLPTVSSRELHGRLERHTIDAVRTGWDGFRCEQEERWSAAFRDLCARFSEKTDAIIDELFRFSAAMFSMPYETVAAKPTWVRQSRFYYKYWDEPPALRIIASSLLLALPAAVAKGVILRRMLRYGRELVETQSGRVRYDFVQRLEQGAREFQTQMQERIDAACKALEGAIRKGIETGAENKVQAEQRRADLLSELRRVDDVADRLRSIAAMETVAGPTPPASEAGITARSPAPADGRSARDEREAS